MALTYDPSPSSGELRQGEIVGEVWEHRPTLAAGQSVEGAVGQIQSSHHARMMVMTQDCDLAQDYTVRSKKGSIPDGLADESDPGVLPHILLCDVFAEGEIKLSVAGIEAWRRIKQNQNERYHALQAGQIKGTQDSLPELFLDFKKTFGFPTNRLYQGLSKGAVSRVAVVPPIFLHDLLHRFYTFLSRVALPE